MVRLIPTNILTLRNLSPGKTGSADCPVTAVYELEDLIKWGKYGVEYTDRIMSMSDFVNYFGSVNQNSNFRLDADGQLVFSVEGTQTEEQQQAVTQAIEAIPGRASGQNGWKIWHLRISSKRVSRISECPGKMTEH